MVKRSIYAFANDVKRTWLANMCSSLMKFDMSNKTRGKTPVRSDHNSRCCLTEDKGSSGQQECHPMKAKNNGERVRYYRSPVRHHVTVPSSFRLIRVRINRVVTQWHDNDHRQETERKGPKRKYRVEERHDLRYLRLHAQSSGLRSCWPTLHLSGGILLGTCFPHDDDCT